MFNAFMDTLRAFDWQALYNGLVGLAAVVALISGPYWQRKLHADQLTAQADLAERQSSHQAAIAHRQIADSLASKRQIWADSIRSDVAELLTLYARILTADITARSLPNGSPQRQAKEDQGELLMEKTHRLEIDIAARLNPEKAGEQKLLNDLTSLKMGMENASRSNAPMEEALWVRLRQQVADDLRVLMLVEWEHIRKGEL